MSETRNIDVTLYIAEKKGDDNPRLPRARTEEASKASNNSNLSTAAAVLLHEAYSYAKQEITQIANYELNKYFNLNDDYIGQRNLAVAKNIISKGASMGTAIASGFAMGGIVGGAIAIVGTTASLGIEIAQNYDQENIKIRQMNAQLSYSRQRAGYSLVSNSVGENL